MDPTSRNRVLMIGGALIVIALLLVCGPLQDRLGGDRPGTTLPPVAAGPPETPDEPAAEPAPVPLAPDAATETANALDDATEEPAEPAVVAAVPAPRDPAAGAGAALETAAAAAAAAASAGESGTAASAPTAAASEMPAVSAAPPPGPTPATIFDDALAATSLGSAGDEVGVGPAGAASDRFAVPVASGGPMALGLQAAQQFGIDSSLLRPCDTPGSGCQNLVSAAGPPNPPIRPGVRPVPPPNPPIQPGTRPTP